MLWHQCISQSPSIGYLISNILTVNSQKLWEIKSSPNKILSCLMEAHSSQPLVSVVLNLVNLLLHFVYFLPFALEWKPCVYVNIPNCVVAVVRWGGSFLRWESGMKATSQRDNHLNTHNHIVSSLSPWVLVTNFSKGCDKNTDGGLEGWLSC